VSQSPSFKGSDAIIADLDLLIGQQEGGKVTRHIRVFADKGL